MAPRTVLNSVDSREKLKAILLAGESADATGHLKVDGLAYLMEMLRENQMGLY